jgi:hypothetical protein
LKTYLNRIVDNFKMHCVNEDVELMRNSKLPYKMIKSNVFADAYLNSKNSLSVKRLLVQLKSCLSYICIDKSVKLLGCRPQGYQNCDICNSKDLEDVYHVMFMCPHYKSPRKFYITKYGTNFTRDNYILIFKALDNSKINDIFKFWKTVIRIRNFIRET